MQEDSGIPESNKFYPMFKTFIGLVLLLAVFGACRSTRNIQTAIAKKDTAIIPAPVHNPRDDSFRFIKEVYGHIQRNQIDFTTFSAKVDVDYRDAEGKKYDVNANIRMYKDSVIWISVTAILGIEGLRAYITPDSVKLLDKQNKIYTARSVAYLQEVTELPLDMRSLQNLLVGNPVFLEPAIVSYEKTATTISLLSLGSFFKNLFTINESDKLVLTSKLDDADGLRNRTCYLAYSDYETKKGFPFATRRAIKISEKKTLDIKLNYKQYEFNETLTFPFTVPKSYKYN
jgi:hypothetical protein